MGLSQTVNMGNYESLRIEVSLRVPCYPEEAVAAYEYAAAFCKERLVAEREGVAETGSKRSADSAVDNRF